MIKKVNFKKIDRRVRIRNQKRGFFVFCSRSEHPKRSVNVRTVGCERELGELKALDAERNAEKRKTKQDADHTKEDDLNDSEKEQMNKVYDRMPFKAQLYPGADRPNGKTRVLEALPACGDTDARKTEKRTEQDVKSCDGKADGQEPNKIPDVPHTHSLPPFSRMIISTQI